MNTGKINAKVNEMVKFNGKNPSENKIDIKKILKEHTKKLFERTRLEALQEGNFDHIIEEIKDSKYGSYMLYVTPSSIPGSSDRLFKVAYQKNNCSNMFSVNLKTGSKQDILDFLGDESNSDIISGYAKILKNRANSIE